MPCNKRVKSFLSRLLDHHQTKVDDVLENTPECAIHIEKAWKALILQHKWTPSYISKVRGLLGRYFLSSNLPRLAFTIHPTLRKPKWTELRQTLIFAPRSQESRFELSTCLPLVVRVSPCNDPKRVFLFWLAGAWIENLRSVSRQHMRRIMRFLNTLVFGDTKWSLPPVCNFCDLNTIKEELAQLTPIQWVARLETIYDKTQRSKNVKFVVFCKEVQMLHTLYYKILHINNDSKHILPFPIPKGQIFRIENRKKKKEEMNLGDSDDGDELEGREVQLALAALRGRVCSDAEHVFDPNQMWAFSPDEVHRILDAAVTSTLEQLIVCLFMTTGLRIGGLCRIRLHAQPGQWAQSVPDRAVTTEKNGKLRTIPLVASVRILIARWWCGERPRAFPHSTWLFPSPPVCMHVSQQTRDVARVRTQIRM